MVLILDQTQTAQAQQTFQTMETDQLRRGPHQVFGVTLSYQEVYRIGKSLIQHETGRENRQPHSIKQTILEHI